MKPCVKCGSTKKIIKKSTGYMDCHPCNRERTKKFALSKGRDYFKHYELMRSYGITLEEYLVLVNKQDNLCAICFKPETLTIKGKLKTLAVDHCHTTGKVRGLLCNNCNRGIGLLQDDLLVLESAITYIKKNKT